MPDPYGNPSGSGNQPGDPGNVAGSQTNANNQYANQASSGGLNGAMNQIMGNPYVVNGPNAGAYNNLYGYSGDLAGSYFNMAKGYQQNAPTINNQFQAQSQGNLGYDRTEMNGLAGYYQNVLNGKGPTVAQLQYQKNQDQAIAANMATANSARGGGSALAGAQRSAQEQAGLMNAQSAAQSGMIRAQEQQAAAQALGGVYGQMSGQDLGQYGLEQNAAIQQAQLGLANQGQQNQYQQFLYGAAQGEQQQQLAALEGYGGQSLNAQQLQLQANGGGQGGSLLSGIGGAAEGLLAASDERLKSPEGNAGSMVDEFLSTVAPRTYRYKSEEYEPNPAHHGMYAGVMAQDLERSEAGRQAVVDTPRGKMVHVPALASLLAAGVARHEERLRSLEGKAR